MNSSIIKNLYLCGLLFSVAFLSLYLFGVSISPSTPCEGWDSCVFKQMGLCILQGKTPYIDIFDHKGPILYFINALGLWISSDKWGVFLINVLNLTIVLFLWTKIAQHYTTGKAPFLVTSLTLALYLSAMDEGNLTEDWSLLPISYSLFIASRYISQDKHPSLFNSFCIGISAGIIFFIRANNSALLIASCILIFFLMTKERKLKILIYTMISTFSGFALISVCVFLFFYAQYGTIGVKEMVYGTFLFNMKYTSWNSYYDFFISSLYNHYFFFLSIVLCIFSYQDNKKDGRRNVLTLFFVLSFVFCYLTMGRHAFRHYLIVVIPLFAMCSAYAFGNKLRPYLLLLAITLLFSEGFLKRQLQYSIGQVKRDYKQLYYQIDNTITASEIKKGIWNYNAGFDGLGYLMHHNATQRNRVILNFQLSVSPELYNPKLYSLKKDLPVYLFVDPNKSYINRQDSIFINTHYKLKKQFIMNSVSKNSDEHISINLYENTCLKHK